MVTHLIVVIACTIVNFVWCMYKMEKLLYRLIKLTCRLLLLVFCMQIINCWNVSEITQWAIGTT